MTEYLFARQDDVDATAALAATADAETAQAASEAAQTAAEAAQTAAEAAQTASEAAQTGAESAQTAAEAAQTAAEAALDSFDDVYLGAKAADPSVDNDGDALNKGDLYFNTTSNSLKAYNGSSWDTYNPLAGLSDVVDDTTPQLGGDLDVNGQSIVSVSDGDIVLTPDGTGLVRFGKAAVPNADDGVALGSTGLKFSDIFLASGAVINFDSGDVTLTHAANALSFVGGAVSFDQSPTVSSNDVLDAGDIGTSVQGFDADTLFADTADVLTAGFATTTHNAGTQSGAGTYTPDEADGNFQRAVNGGAHTLAPPSNDTNIVVQYTNNASAGIITTSGFTKVTGDSLDTTDGNDFLLFITKINGFSHLNVAALQ